MTWALWQGFYLMSYQAEIVLWAKSGIAPNISYFLLILKQSKYYDNVFLLWYRRSERAVMEILLLLAAEEAIRKWHINPVSLSSNGWIVIFMIGLFYLNLSICQVSEVYTGGCAGDELLWISWKYPALAPDQRWKVPDSRDQQLDLWM